MKLNTNQNATTRNSRRRQWVKPFVSLAMTVIMFCNTSSMMDTIALAATKPLTYYQKVEKANLNKQVDTITKAYGDYLSEYQKALKLQIGMETTMQVNIDPNMLKGTPVDGLKSIKATMLSMSKGMDSKTDIKLACNDQELTSMQVYSLDNLIYMLIPDLSKAYLKMDMNSTQGVVSSAQMQKNILEYFEDPISEDLLNTELKKYGNIVISKIDNVTQKNNVSVTIDGVKSSYTKLTASINEKSALNIAKSILETANKDTKLRNLLIDLGVCTKKQYTASIKDALADVTVDLKALSKKKSNGKTVMKMDLWVNGKGDIAGRDLKVYDGKEVLEIGYRTTKSGIKMGVEAWMQADGKDVLRGTGSLTGSLTGVSGKFKIAFTDSNYDSTSVINVAFKDVKYSELDNIGYLNGEASITGSALSGMSFNMKFNADSGKQDFVFDIVQSNMTLASVTATSKYVPFVDFTGPTSADKVYNMETQINDYITTADMAGFLKGIKEKSDLDFIDKYVDGFLATPVTP